MAIKSKILSILVYCILNLVARSEPVEDKQALLDFISNINHSRSLNWDKKTSACHRWIGVTCNHDNSRIIAVRLPAFGFKSMIPNNTLSRLSALEILGLRSNGIIGPFPSDLLKLENLVGLYLDFNSFHGPLPLTISVMKNLSVLSLSNNAFTGEIPTSLSNLTHLTALHLANNFLSGDIPDINIPSLQVIDLSNNSLTGSVPSSLLRFPSSVFSFNNVSFENSSSAPTHTETAAPDVHRSKLSEPVILGIVIGCCSVAFISIALLLVFTSRIKKHDRPNRKMPQKKGNSTITASSEGLNERGSMTFFVGCHNVFDLEDLLRASAEVLGKGTFGTTYKAALEDATIVAVKRLKEVVVGRKEFEQLMEIVGNIRHDNVAPLRAYYYSTDEKLMVYDYYSYGSMSALLHGKRGEDRIPVDWETRLKIAVGAAKGIAHIHSQDGRKLIHGNIKASNILINSHLFGCVSDLGIATLMSHPVTPPVMHLTGCCAPEVADTRKLSQAADVYGFGVILLELLTGKSSIYAPRGEESVHLVRWVQSVVHEEWTGEVFDLELLRYNNIEEEMVAMLQIGLSCVAKRPEHRPKMAEVVKMLEDFRSPYTGSCPSAGTISLASTTPNSHAGEVGSSYTHS